MPDNKKKKQGIMDRISTYMADKLYTPIVDFNGMQKLSDDDLKPKNPVPDQVDSLTQLLKARLKGKAKVTVSR